ncbi:MAG: isochorismatase family cysteine hydrolase [Lachnospiraceae bacterium]|nr:isochorismatase family cysteine hydrolase [Lachnospiraceae bacterium]
MSRLLVVVDMQKDFVDGALGTPQACGIVPSVVHKIQEETAAGSTIIFTKDTHGTDYLETQEGRKLPVVHCVKGTPGWELVPELLPFADGRKVIEKNTFGSTMLAHLAGKMKFDEIELIGLCTDICVISNAMILKAALPEAVIRVCASCCAGVTPQSHLNALEAMKMCQIEVI